LSRRLFSAAAEEGLDEVHGASGENARGDFYLVIQLRMIEYAEGGFDGTSLGVVGTVDEALDAGVGDGSGAHGAGFDGDKEFAIAEAIIAKSFSGFAKGEDFGVGGRVGVGDRAIGAASDYLVAADDDGPDGNFAECGRSLRFAQSFFHPEFIRMSWHQST
jgi:hypothetical protein